MTEDKSLFRQTDDDVRSQARNLLHQARFASLATLDVTNGYPAASRILIGTDEDGTPVTLISSLASHTRNLLADRRCSIMVGEPGKGDPLASPRIMIACEAEKIDKNSPKCAKLRSRFLEIHPKSKIYVDFDDFSFFSFGIVQVLFNAGFGKAYNLQSSDFNSA